VDEHCHALLVANLRDAAHFWAIGRPDVAERICSVTWDAADGDFVDIDEEVS
jgi:hypothetical protein